jgi:hypothetical protein
MQKKPVTKFTIPSDESFKETRIEDSYLNIIKAICDKPIAE